MTPATRIEHRDLAACDAVIRTARSSDLDLLVDIDARIFGFCSYPRFVMRQFIDMFHEGLFIVEQHGEVIGYSALGVEQGTPNAWLLSIGLLESGRGQGLGDELMRYNIDFCKAQGVSTIKLSVSVENQYAVHVYGSKGFRITSTEADYYDKGFSRHIMELKID